MCAAVQTQFDERSVEEDSDNDSGTHSRAHTAEGNEEVHEVKTEDISLEKACLTVPLCNGRGWYADTAETTTVEAARKWIESELIDINTILDSIPRLQQNYEVRCAHSPVITQRVYVRVCAFVCMYVCVLLV